MNKDGEEPPPSPSGSTAEEERIRELGKPRLGTSDALWINFLPLSTGKQLVAGTMSDVGGGSNQLCLTKFFGISSATFASGGGGWIVSVSGFPLHTPTPIRSIKSEYMSESCDQFGKEK